VLFVLAEGRGQSEESEGTEEVLVVGERLVVGMDVRLDLVVQVQAKELLAEVVLLLCKIIRLIANIKKKIIL